MATTLHTFAIEGLKISLQSSNVVLSWPSMTNETFIVQFRSAFGTNTPWQMLTNNLPADPDTNLTVFYHSNQVSGASTSGGESGGGSSSPPPSDSNGGKEKQPKKDEWPPVPWDESTWLTNSNTMDGGINSETPSSCGFYQVVRTGPHLFGLTTGTVVSGIIKVPVELGIPTDDPALALYLTDPSGSIPSFQVPEMTNLTNTLEAVWDTTLVTNGTYLIQLGANLGSGAQLAGTTVSVTVANQIWFPNFWGAAGEALRVEAQTIFPNGTWEMDLYDDGDNYLTTFSGTIDENGFCNYPDIQGPGFSISLLDENGQQFPSTSYTIVVTANSANGPGFAAASSATQAVVAYQRIFGNSENSGNGLLLREMVNSVRYALNAFHTVINGTDELPFAIYSPERWAILSTDLAKFPVRDFYFFGHGGTDHIGYTNRTEQINVKDLNLILTNAPNPLVGVNQHPYRFVFLDGCRTANGHLCAAFGIPEIEKMPLGEFYGKRGIRPRAFLGWSTTKTSSFIGDAFFNTDHATFINRLLSRWSEFNAGAGRRYTLEEAIAYARVFQYGGQNPASFFLIQYGARELLMAF